MKLENLKNLESLLVGLSALDFKTSTEIKIDNCLKDVKEAINLITCCTELLCVKADVDGLTAGKYYKELRKDRTYTTVVDDYGIETMYFSDRFVKPPKQ
jgi:hypothetical protein